MTERRSDEELLAEGARLAEFRHPSRHDNGVGIVQGSHFRAGFASGYVAGHAAGVADTVPTRQEIADEISGIQVGAGYESTTIGISAALEAADAVLALLMGGEKP